MRIGLILANIPAYSETFFTNKIRGLQENQHEVILLVNTPKTESTYLNCKVVNAPDLTGNAFRAIFISAIQVLKAIFLNPEKSIKLYRLNQEDGISLKKNVKQILANQFLLPMKLDWLHFGFATMALGRENVATVIGAKMAVSFRGFDYYVYPVKNPHCYSVLFSKNIKYHVLSDAMKNGLMNYGIDNDNIVKITPAIDTKIFSSLHEKNGSSLLQIKTVSRLHMIKGLDYILEALALLKKKRVSFHFSIIGEGAEKERLQFAVYQLNLSENVTFLGKQSPEKVKEELENTDIYVQYSNQEGFCNAVLEAQAMGFLCIVSDAEGLQENVLDKQTGWVVPKRNPKRLAEKIQEVAELHISEKEKIRRNATERVQREFNLEKQKQEFLKFYNV